MASWSTHQELEKLEDAFSESRSSRVLGAGKKFLNRDELGKNEVEVVDVGGKARHTRRSSRERLMGCRLDV